MALRGNGSLWGRGRSRQSITALAALVALVSVLLGGFISRVQANPTQQIVELAHTPITAVQGTHALIPKKGGGYDFRGYTPTQIGDAITFSVTVHKSGIYRLQTTSYKDSAEGIYRLEVDGVEIGQKDFYLSNVWEHGQFDIEAGTYLITYRCIGKNPRSKGIGVKLDTLHFR